MSASHTYGKLECVRVLQYLLLFLQWSSVWQRHDSCRSVHTYRHASRGIDQYLWAQSGVLLPLPVGVSLMYADIWITLINLALSGCGHATWQPMPFWSNLTG